MGQVINMRDYEPKRRHTEPPEVSAMIVVLSAARPSYAPFFALMSDMVMDAWLKPFFPPGGIDGMWL